MSTENPKEDSEASALTGKHDAIVDKEKLGKYLLFVMFTVALILFINIIRIFVIDIILAAVFATLFFPVFKMQLKPLRGNKGLAAFFTCVLVLVGILIPLVFISKILVNQAIDLYGTAGMRVHDLILRGDSGIMGKLRNTPIGQWADLNNVDWQSIVKDMLNNIGSFVASLVKKTSRATLGGVVNLFIILFSIFYFLRDGESMLKKLRDIMPLSEVYKDRLIDRFTSISRATVKGTLFVALVQALLGAVILFGFGVDSWMLWAIVMLFFSLIPFVGPGAVLIPTGLIKIFMGDILAGMGIILLSISVVSTIDNILRPRLVGHDTGMHDLLVFFSTLGGIVAFGPSGFIIGPLISAIFLTMLEIYRIEFQNIEHSKKPITEKQAAEK